LTEQEGDARVRVEPHPELALSTWVYALVAQFPSVVDGISFEELIGRWKSDGPPATFVGDNVTASLMTIALGDPGQESLQILPPEDLLDATWSPQPPLAIVPFETLDPRWKVLAIDGLSPVRKEFDLASYPLSVQFGLSGDTDAVSQLAAQIRWPSGNRQESKMTVVVMTGVTALVRATAWRMELNGAEYPGAAIREWLLGADITHVSNEVSFAADCPPADPYQASLRFCSHPSYSDLLANLNIDVVELSGNHLLDWSVEAFLDTLDLYEALDIATFGGGRDLDQSLEPLLIEHNGNRLAFLGCNAAGPERVWATTTSPGAAPCAKDEILATLEQIAAEGSLPIFTFQWKESKRAGPLSDQIEAFQQAVERGAVIVSGSQAHQPQTLEFYRGRLIHYGLGNLFFDQMENLANRQEFIDRHIFYDGRHISTELLTALLEDFSQPRPMSEEERKLFLIEMFAASGW
jgi:poly-gamma-glutamate synthesis protein (capsule biosynthesis protein)